MHRPARLLHKGGARSQKSHCLSGEGICLGDQTDTEERACFKMNSIKVLSVALYDCCACGAREASHTRFTKQPEHQTGQGWGWEGAE